MRRLLGALIIGLVFTGGVARADSGQEIFEKKCAGCHGKDGKGETKMGKERKVADLTSADVQAKFTDDEATKAINDGILEKDTGKKRMPGFKEKLSADEIASVLKTVRGFAPKK